MAHIAPQPTSVSVEARVIRRDGTVEELGTLAYWHRNPIRRALWRLRQAFRGKRAGKITHGGQ